MTHEQRQKAIEIFDATLELEPDQRNAFIDDRCKDDHTVRNEVLALLASYEKTDHFLEPPVRAAAFELLSDFTHSGFIGQQIGSYTLTSLIATGGMGTVYLAEPIPPSNENNNVAIKLIRRGMASPDILQRFHKECQTLAGLEHENIARQLEGGISDQGIPYLAMEYIDGLPIDQYCDNNNLSVQQRLELFRKVCSAVQYAHQNLIIHRDIKPSNILILQNGTPKLLDFGIAKLIQPTNTDITMTVTSTGLQMITPQYASPEVIRQMPASTAMDVYSLGLLLYELLTGRRAYNIKHQLPHEIERLICETDPPAPSSIVTQAYEFYRSDGTTRKLTAEDISLIRRLNPFDLRRVLRGDLDTVILKALHKDPKRRYPTVEQLSQDIERFLSGFGVLAQKDSLGYRAQKFIKRNKALALASLIIFISLIGGITGTTWGLFQAKHEAARARKEAVKAQQINLFLQDMLASVDPDEGNRDILVREVLDLSSRRIDQEFANLPEVKASIQHTIGRTYLNLGLHQDAQPHLQAALDLRKKNHPQNHPEIAESLLLYGEMLFFNDKHDEALAVLDEARTMYEKLFGNRHETIVKVLNAIARVHDNAGRYEESIKMFRQSLTICQSLHPDNHADTTDTMEKLSVALSNHGQYEKAIELSRKSLQMNQNIFHAEHPRIATNLKVLALALQRGNKNKESESLYRQALALYQTIYGHTHPDIARILNNLGVLISDQGKIQEAQSMLQEALDMRRSLYGNDHHSVAVTLQNLATIMTAELAEPLLRESLEISRNRLGNDHPNVAQILSNLGANLYSRGLYEEATPLYRESLAIFKKRLPENHFKLSYPMLGLGNTLLRKGEHELAHSLLLESLRLRKLRFPDHHPAVLIVTTSMGQCLTHSGKYEQAQSMLINSHEQLKTQLGASHELTRKALSALIQLYETWDQKEKLAQYQSELKAVTASMAKQEP